MHAAAARSIAPAPRRRDLAPFWPALLLAAYGGARACEVFPGALPHLGIVALDVFSAAAFAFLDGARTYGRRGILAFAGICLLVGNVVENIGVATGFPFGRYVFLELMGPRVFRVPVLLGLAYVGMAYASWRVASLILGRSGRGGLLYRPALASVIMTLWDLAQDPVWGTVLHGWVWRDGGVWFGVPLSNYGGWLGTVFLIYLLFALYLGRRPDAAAREGAEGSRRAVLFYALCALGNVLEAIPRSGPPLVADATGKLWRVADITRAAALVSILGMGSFALMAWLRGRGERGAAA